MFDRDRLQARFAPHALKNVAPFCLGKDLEQTVQNSGQDLFQFQRAAQVLGQLDHRAKFDQRTIPFSRRSLGGRLSGHHDPPGGAARRFERRRIADGRTIGPGGILGRC